MIEMWEQLDDCDGSDLIAVLGIDEAVVSLRRCCVCI